MKARKVKGLDARGPLTENLRRIADVRIDELFSFGEAAMDPDEVEALHDMRIAAKRVRYVLELGEPALGPAAKEGAKQARRLQDLLGEIHDCDEAVPRVRAHIERLRAEDAAAMRDSASTRVKDLGPAAAREAKHRRRYPGLEALLAYNRARREVLYRSFVREWARIERTGFRESLTSKLA